MSDNPSHQRLLRVPSPANDGLSFCEPNPRALKGWLDSLPRANLGEMARRLYQALTELNQLRTDPPTRLRLLELLRAEVQQVCRLLERNFLDKPIVLDERSRKVASLCQALQHHVVVGYKLVVVQLTEVAPSDQLPLLTIALQRALVSLRGPIVRAYQLYCPVPEGVWLDLHRLYLIGVEHGVQRTAVADDVLQLQRRSSIEQAYTAALLLGCARCNQVRQGHIARLAEALDLWAPLAPLESSEQVGSLFVVLPQADGPPRYRALLAEQDARSGYGLETRRLVAAIEATLDPLSGPADPQLEIPEGFSDDLLRHLTMAWGSTAERAFQRSRGTGSLTVCIGMTSVHYYLAGERTFDAVIAQPEAPTAATFSLQGGEPDVWSHAFDAKRRIVAPSVDGHIDFPRDTPATPAEELYPTYELDVINISPGGYCLGWPGEVPAQLHAGELLGVRDSGGWRVAAVRWLRQVRGAGTQMGVELIGPKADACGIRLVRKMDQGSQYLRALLLPPVDAISQPPSLIAPRLPFQEGQKVLLAHGGEERRAALSRRLTGTASYNQFAYRGLGIGSQAETSVTPGDGRPAGRDEDFDSLWKSL